MVRAAAGSSCVLCPGLQWHTVWWRVYAVCKKRAPLTVLMGTGPFRTAPNCLFSEPRDLHAVDVPDDLILVDETSASSASTKVVNRLVGTVATDAGGSCLAERNAGGVVTGDFDGDGLEDVFAGRLDKPPVLYRNLGNGTFQDVAQEAGLHVRGSACGQAVTQDTGMLLATGSNAGAFFDADNDGDLDLFVTTLGLHRHALFINNGAGRFTEEACERSIGGVELGDPSLTSGTSATVADFDGDGYLDLYVGEWRMYYTRNYSTVPGDDGSVRTAKSFRASNSRLFRNRGAGRPGFFDDVTDAAGMNVEPVAREMLQRDQLSLPIPAAVLRSERHASRSITNGAYTFAPVWADFDGDGFDDLFIASDFCTSMLWWNNGNGTFTEGSREAGLGGDQNGMGATVADVDGDGRLDLFVSAIHSYREQNELTGFGTAGSFLYLNRCDGREHRGTRRCVFVDATNRTGVGAGHWSWGAAFLDYDNDADLDLFVANGYLMPESTFDDEWNKTPFRLYQNPQDGVSPAATTWPDVAQAVGVNDMEPGRGVAVFDYDMDGDLDIFTASFAGAARLFRNDGATGAWVRVRVVEHSDRGGRDSIGARVSLLVRGDGVHRQQVARVGSTTAFQGQSESVVHFGLGDLPTDASSFTLGLRVEWQHPQQQLLVTGVQPNRLVVVQRPPMDAPALCTADGGSTCQQRPPVLPPVPLAVNVNLTTPLDDDGLAPGGEGWGPATSEPGVVLPEGLDEADARRIGVDGLAVPMSPRVEPKAGHGVGQTIIMYEAQQTRSWPEPRSHSIDGTGNSAGDRGRVGDRLLRTAAAGYADGISKPVGADTPTAAAASVAASGEVAVGQTDDGSVAAHPPSPRAISNALFDQGHTLMPDPSGLNDMHAHFGQFLSHDLDHTTPQPNAAPESFFPIMVPRGDAVFDPNATGTSVLRFRRSIFDPATGVSTPREQVNTVTAFLDGSVVYGRDPARLHALRKHVGGMLLTSANEASLPLNAKALPNDNPLARRTKALHLAGDVRVNIQPGLLAMHTLFVREHNRVAEMLRAHKLFAAGLLGTGQPDPAKLAAAMQGAAFSDDAIFAGARRVVIAELQAVVYNDYLPLLVGPDALPPYTGYKPDVNPGVTTEFATAAFRFGHSQANQGFEILTMQDTSAGSRGTIPDAAGQGLRHRLGRDVQWWRVPLNLTYFQPRWVQRLPEGGIDPLLRGMLVAPAQRIDAKAVDALRNHMFGTVRQGGTDLVAVNIQRGRDHGLGDYNSVREAFGLPAHTSFEGVTGGDEELAASLRQLYGDEASGGLARLDLFVGGLCEPPVPPSVLGETFTAIVVDQFTRIRDGDRFWYENPDVRDSDEIAAGGEPVPMFDDASLATLRRMKMKDLLAHHVKLPARLRRGVSSSAFKVATGRFLDDAEQ